MTKKKTYDHTGAQRVERHRKALAEAGGARVEAHLDAEDLLRLDAAIAAGKAGSRRAALKYAVGLLPLPGKDKA
jgi:predicted metal-dependent phosphoesterase TrpH